ncbi:MAG TPA: methyltransferase domain-containing protein [Stellaceae bacterium]|nr:methyltransferase domain-containing protein [Stellaceae bacterium]
MNPPSDTTEPMLVFDRSAVRAHRERAAGLPAEHRFLRREVAARLIDRLADVKGRFETVLDLGCGDGEMADLLEAAGRPATVISLDAARGFARRGPRPVVAEEEALPFKPASIDLVLSTLGLHWTNDLPGALLQIRQILRPDGLLLAGMLGGETLHELRAALLEAELAEESGASPRISPFADLRDAGALLQRAGLALPVVDADTITVTYPDALALMRDLRGMGETNAGRHRRRSFTRRATLLRAAAIYAERFAGPDGRIPASFQILFLTGWAPAPSQPKALRPGSATARLADVLGAPERGTGERTGRGV